VLFGPEGTEVLSTDEASVEIAVPAGMINISVAAGRHAQ